MANIKIKTPCQIKEEGLLSFKEAVEYCNLKYPHTGSWNYQLRRSLSKDRDIPVFRPGLTRTAKTFFNAQDLDKWLSKLWKNKSV